MLTAKLSKAYLSIANTVKSKDKQTLQRRQKHDKSNNKHGVLAMEYVVKTVKMLQGCYSYSANQSKSYSFTFLAYLIMMATFRNKHI